MAGSLQTLQSASIEDGITFVTVDGVIRRSDGTYEVWQPGAAVSSPLSRKMLVTEAQSALEVLQRRIVEGEETLSTASEKSARLADELRNLQERLSEARRAAAQAQGEFTRQPALMRLLKTAKEMAGSQFVSLRECQERARLLLV